PKLLALLVKPYPILRSGQVARDGREDMRDAVEKDPLAGRVLQQSDEEEENFLIGRIEEHLRERGQRDATDRTSKRRVARLPALGTGQPVAIDGVVRLPARRQKSRGKVLLKRGMEEAIGGGRALLRK